MGFKYSVKGKVGAGFIMRGHYYPVGTDINMNVTENEMLFLREHCGEIKVEALETKPLEIPEPVLEKQEKPKGETKNVVQVQQRKSVVNKGTNKAKVQS